MNRDVFSHCVLFREVSKPVLGIAPGGIRKAFVGCPQLSIVNVY